MIIWGHMREPFFISALCRVCLGVRILKLLSFVSGFGFSGAGFATAAAELCFFWLRFKLSWPTVGVAATHQSSEAGFCCSSLPAANSQA